MNSGWSACGPSLIEFDCVKDLGFKAPASTGSLYNPTNTPVAGTKVLSNLAGEVTAPASGAIFTWSAAGMVYTITALSAEGKDAETTAQDPSSSKDSSGGASVAGSSSTPTGEIASTSTSAAPAETSKPSSASKLIAALASTSVVAALALVLIVCM